MEAKHLGYQVTGYDRTIWIENGYGKCYQGIKAKFDQNADLFNMLKTTTPKLLVESSNDKIWGTGISIRDTNALK